MVPKITAHLRLQGADAQKHPVYAELKRIQQSFGKIKAAEEAAEGSQDTSAKEGRSLVVNQEAAARMLKADLVSVIEAATFS